MMYKEMLKELATEMWCKKREQETGNGGPNLKWKVQGMGSGGHGHVKEGSGSK